MNKRAPWLLLVVLLWPGVAFVVSAPPAQAVVTSRVCTSAGSCVTASTGYLPSNSFTVKVTCNASETVYASVRGYVANGNFSTAPAKRYSCTPGVSFTATRSYIGGRFVAYQAALGFLPAASRLGNYVGAPVAVGHELSSNPLGFHWE